MNQENLANKLNDWLRENGWALPKCPISGKGNWGISEDIVEFRPFARGALVADASVYPAVMIICEECGYTMFVNAAMTGVLLH